MESIPHICDKSQLPPDSPWTCSFDRTFYSASVIWGLVGPRRIFGNLGYYSHVNWFFLAGAIAPCLIWLAHKAFPKQNWIRLINMPVLLGATMMMPPASAVNFISWIIVGFLSGYIFFRYRPKLWERYNYILSGGLDAGTAFMTILIFFCLQYVTNISLDWWGNHSDDVMCPLAKCPTAKGIVVDGCPVFWFLNLSYCFSAWFMVSFQMGLLIYLVVIVNTSPKGCDLIYKELRKWGSRKG